MQMGVGGTCKKCGNPLEIRSVTPPRVAPPPPMAPSPAEVNPYAPPSAASGGVGYNAPDGLWQDGKILVASLDAQFPDRCVKCNQPAAGYRLKRKLTWHPSAWYLLIIVHVLIYAIVATFIQKKTIVHIGLCETHRKRRSWLIGLGLALPLLAIAGCTAMMGDPNRVGAGVGLGALGALAGVVLLIVGSNVLSAASIDERFARIKGAHRLFLASLPSFHG